jgi:hypothetical protein
MDPIFCTARLKHSNLSNHEPTESEFDEERIQHGGEWLAKRCCTTNVNSEINPESTETK